MYMIFLPSGFMLDAYLKSLYIGLQQSKQNEQGGICDAQQ